MGFLHGVEVIETTSGPLPITVVRSGVIGLVGTAPTWLVSPTNPIQPPVPNTPVTVASAEQMSQFGPMVQGYTIPYALNAMFIQGSQAGTGPAIVINVFNELVHYSTITAKNYNMPSTGAQAISVGQMGLLSGSVTVTNSTNTLTYVNGSDYTVDLINGVVTAVAGGAITAGETLLITYNYADPTKVTTAEIVGAVTNGQYTGIQALMLAFNLFGYTPKILEAPGYSQELVVGQALQTMASTLRAVCVLDGALNTNPVTAVSNRGALGNGFNVSSDRVILVSPNQMFPDIGIIPTGVTLNQQGLPVVAQSNTNSDSYYSQWFVGVMSSNDYKNGYWWSPSNQSINGLVGPDVSMYMSMTDPNADTNNLNAAGIVTVFNAFASGLRVWGNRSSAYPVSTAPSNFIPIRRTLDVLEESIQLGMLQFMDGPISLGKINSVRKSVNDLIRVLIGRGGLLPGSTCLYLKSSNPASQLAKGIVVFKLSVMPPPPMEQIQYDVYTNISLLQSIGPTTTI